MWTLGLGKRTVWEQVRPGHQGAPSAWVSFGLSVLVSP
jgi:hypothetical protein